MMSACCTEATALTLTYLPFILSANVHASSGTVQPHTLQESQRRSNGNSDSQQAHDEHLYFNPVAYIQAERQCLESSFDSTRGQGLVTSRAFP